MKPQMLISCSAYLINAGIVNVSIQFSAFSKYVYSLTLALDRAG